VALTTDTLRVMLRVAWAKTNAAQGSLQTVLTNLMTGQHTVSESGKLSTSRGAGDLNSADTPLRDVNPTYRAEGYSQLLDLFDTAKANLIAAGTADPTDAQVNAEMMGLLVPRYECTNDFAFVGLGRS
jgi:hypothetical protein